VGPQIRAQDRGQCQSATPRGHLAQPSPRPQSAWCLPGTQRVPSLPKRTSVWQVGNTWLTGQSSPQACPLDCGLTAKVIASIKIRCCCTKGQFTASGDNSVTTPPHPTPGSYWLGNGACCPFYRVTRVPFTSPQFSLLPVAHPALHTPSGLPALEPLMAHTPWTPGMGGHCHTFCKRVLSGSSQGCGEGGPKSKLQLLIC
jgi:hypothetical protein